MRENPLRRNFDKSWNGIIHKQSSIVSNHLHSVKKRLTSTRSIKDGLGEILNKKKLIFSHLICIIFAKLQSERSIFDKPRTAAYFVTGE